FVAVTSGEIERFFQPSQIRRVALGVFGIHLPRPAQIVVAANGMDCHEQYVVKGPARVFTILGILRVFALLHEVRKIIPTDVLFLVNPSNPS
ncbi:MAG: hypothetical protein ACXWYM_23820, partial [Candidatus Binatia bacterium]